MDELMEISREHIRAVKDIYPRSEISYGTMTGDFCILSDPICADGGETDWLLEAYMGRDGEYSIIRNDAGMHDAAERFAHVMHEWSEELQASARA